MNNKLQKYETLSYELDHLYKKVQRHIEEQKTAESYVYSDTYCGWVSEYNKLVKRYNDLTGADLSMQSVQVYDLSATQKTVRTNAADAFSQSIKDLVCKIDSEIQDEKNKETPIPTHQMRVCFKTGSRGCPLNPSEKKNRVFIAMPFSDDYKDSYEYGIRIALEQLGLDHYKADNEISNKDIMCKICCEIQSCDKLIANISELNPNVMLELGLAYGLGKYVIIIKNKKTISISDLGSIEYIEYAHAKDLQDKLLKILES